MARKRRHPDAVDIHEQQRSIRENQAPTIGDEFPDVVHIRINLTFEDFDEKCDPKPVELNYSPESRSFFELKCPYWECVMGGFNFSAPVQKAVREQLPNLKGTEKCGGWQDRERINKNPCYLKAHYEVYIQY